MPRKVLLAVSWLLGWLLCLVTVVSCGGGQKTVLAAASSGASVEQLKVKCSVPDLPDEIQAALCSGDANRLRSAVFHVEAKPGEPVREHTLAALRRVLDRDPSLGSDLPWTKLGMPAVKAVLVDTLAQAVRNQEIDASLPEMQRIAKELLAAERDVDQFEGVRLLGLTNDAAEIPLLKQIATSNDPSVRRHNAIEALGYICDPVAKETLEDLAKTPAIPSTDGALIHGALATRARLDASWCRKYPGVG